MVCPRGAEPPSSFSLSCKKVVCFALPGNPAMKNAEAYYATSISLPIFTTLTVKEQDKVVSIISNYFSKIKLSN